MSRRKRTLVVLGLVTAAGILVAGLVWRGQSCRAHILLSGTGQYEARLASRRRLVAYGDRCAGPIVETLEELSPWTRSTVALPGVLGEIGEDAHRRLIEEIDRTTDPDTRAFLVSSLQSAFQDWSRFHLVLADATEGRLSEWASTNVMREFRGRYPDAPQPSSDDPTALLEWWSDQAKSGL